jgi:hypothetical protein
MSREEIASHFLDAQEKQVSEEASRDKQIEGGEQSQESEEADLDSRPRHFLDAQEKQEDKNNKFEGIDMTGDRRGVIKVEKGEQSINNINEFFAKNADKLASQEVKNSGISKDAWVEQQTKKLQSKVEQLGEGSDIELDFADPENIEVIDNSDGMGDYIDGEERDAKKFEKKDNKTLEEKDDKPKKVGDDKEEKKLVNSPI